MLDKIKQLYNKPKLTKTDRAWIIEQAKIYNISINTNCSSCYKDTLLLLQYEYERAKVASERSAIVDDNRKYILKEGVDIIFGTIRVNELTLTDELGEYLIKRGMPTRYFAKYEDNR